MGEETNVEEILKKIVEKFNEKMEKDSELLEKIKDLERTIMIKLGEAGIYVAKLQDGKLSDFEKVQEEVKAEIRLETDPDTFVKIVNGEISPMVAYMDGRVKFKAPLRDMMLLKDLLS